MFGFLSCRFFESLKINMPKFHFNAYLRGKLYKVEDYLEFCLNHTMCCY